MTTVSFYTNTGVICELRRINYALDLFFSPNSSLVCAARRCLLTYVKDVFKDTRTLSPTVELKTSAMTFSLSLVLLVLAVWEVQSSGNTFFSSYKSFFFTKILFLLALLSVTFKNKYVLKDLLYFSFY